MGCLIADGMCWDYGSCYCVGLDAGKDYVMRIGYLGPSGICCAWDFGITTFTYYRGWLLWPFAASWTC